jgi:hypothetical protein
LVSMAGRHPDACVWRRVTAVICRLGGWGWRFGRCRAPHDAMSDLNYKSAASARRRYGRPSRARRPAPSRRGEAGLPCHERHRPVRAVPAPGRPVGRGRGRGVRRRGRRGARGRGTRVREAGHASPGADPRGPRARLRPDRGHPLHAEPGLDQFYAWRPMFGHGRYRIGGIDGLYLCGSGAHPGGGITGGPGQNAAREVFDPRRRWQKRPPPIADQDGAGIYWPVGRARRVYATAHERAVRRASPRSRRLRGLSSEPSGPAPSAGSSGDPAVQSRLLAEMMYRRCPARGPTRGLEPMQQVLPPPLPT